jgi:hypothetical protein
MQINAKLEYISSLINFITKKFYLNLHLLESPAKYSRSEIEMQAKIIQIMSDSLLTHEF